MPVLPEVASTMVVRPGSIRPSRSAASIIATPIRSLTLPAGFWDSSLAISSAGQPGATRVSRTSGVSPTRSARLSGTPAPERPRSAVVRARLIQERLAGARTPLELEHQPDLSVLGPVRSVGVLHSPTEIDPTAAATV